MACVERIKFCCRDLAEFLERGVKQDDPSPGLRFVGIERRATIAFRVGEDTATFLGILYGGRDVERLVIV